MFGIQFYPTPYWLASKMVEPYRDAIKAGAFVLDPSAGKGDLLNAARACTKFGQQDRQLFAVEIDPDLQAVLRDRKFKVIGDDWMQYASHYHFDIVLMNPPFAAGAAHLLKAWDVLKSGHIACLLNAETIRNPYTSERQLLANIIEQYGTVEYIENAFGDAERSTGVEVALVRLEKKAADRFGFDGIAAGGGSSDTRFQEAMSNAPARRDLVTSLVITYDQIADALEQWIRAELRLRSLTSDFWSGYVKSDAERKELEQGPTKADGPAAYFNAYMDSLKRAAWHQLFNRTAMRQLVTAKVRQDWEAFQAVQGTAEFNTANINNFFEMLMLNRVEILNRCVLEVFDLFTRYDKKNTVHVEGWKTNSAYKVNRKVIIPGAVSNWTGSWGHSLSVNHRKYDQLGDIDRAMCLITGDKYPDGTRDENNKPIGIYTILEALQDALRADNRTGGETESHFFHIKYFIKGTMHITFKDESLWKRFNMAAAKGKGWIGDGE